MNTRTDRWVVFLGALLLLLSLACSTGGTISTVVPTPSPQANTGNAAETSPTLPPVATNTPLPADTPPTDVPPVATPLPAASTSTFAAHFVRDVTVPDNSVLSPGTPFVKTWRVRNSGTRAWEAGTKLVFISADQMGGPPSVDVPPVEVGAETDVSVNLVSPVAAGTYVGNWQLQSADGVRFGPILTVKIVVTGAPPATVAPGGSTPTLPVPCVAVDPILKPIYDHIKSLGYDIGCPTQPARLVQGAFQEYWANVEDVNPHTHFRSLMIWRADTREIYVLDGDNTDCSSATLLDYTDTWQEGQPAVYPDCQAMTVPDGYIMPVRGFGKVWCYNQLKERVGWPAQKEAAVTFVIQPTQTGLLMSAPVQSTWGYLIALDYRAVKGITMTVPR